MLLTCADTRQVHASHASITSIVSPRNLYGAIALGMVCGVTLVLSLLFCCCDILRRNKLRDTMRKSFMRRGMTDVNDTHVFNSDALLRAREASKGGAQRQNAGSGKYPASTATASRCKYRCRLCCRLPCLFTRAACGAVLRHHPVTGPAFIPRQQQVMVSRGKTVLVSMSRVLAAMALAAGLLDPNQPILESRLSAGVRGALLGLPLMLLLPKLLKVASTATSSIVILRARGQNAVAILAPESAKRNQTRQRWLTAVQSFTNAMWESGLITPGRRAVQALHEAGWYKKAQAKARRASIMAVPGWTTDRNLADFDDDDEGKGTHAMNQYTLAEHDAMCQVDDSPFSKEARSRPSAVTPPPRRRQRRASVWGDHSSDDEEEEDERPNLTFSRMFGGNDNAQRERCAACVLALPELTPTVCLLLLWLISPR